MDATIIAALASTKNRDKARDPEMHKTKKGKEWHFWHEAAYWRRQCLWFGSYPDYHVSEHS